MKYIVKKQEPIEFSDWKANDKMYQRNNPKWNRLPSSIKEIIRKNLVDEQGGICCYCERELLENDFHIEHLKPKDKNKYPELQLEYDNLICSCQFELEKKEPRHCGNSKGSWYDDNTLISPLSPDCEAQFKYTHDGYIEPYNKTNVSASTTIQRLRLDLDKLNKMREKAIEPFLDETLTLEELQLFVEKYLEEENGKFNPFYTTIKFLFENN